MNDRNRIHSLPLHISTNYKRSQLVDSICRFESLQLDIDLVKDQINLPRTRLPYLNTSDHQHYSIYYRQDEIDQVEKLYQNDIAFYGYMFEDNIPAKTFSKLHKNNWLFQPTVIRDIDDTRPSDL